MYHYLVTLLLIVCVPVAAISSENNDKQYQKPPDLVVPDITSKIEIDGDLNEKAWEHAATVDLEYEISPRTNAPALVKTTVYLLSDNHCFYIGFKCYDPDPGLIKSDFHDHDRCGSDDLVGVFLDTFNDNRRGYLFLGNPAGSQYDAIKTDDLEDSSWDTIWESAGTIHEWGYSVEFALPFSSVSFQRAENGPQVWGFEAIRIYPRNLRHQIISAEVDPDNDSLFEQFRDIIGFEGADPGRDIEITPTITALSADERPDFPDGELENRDRKADTGITATWGITNNIELCATINPDFSQVEADSIQLDINSPFALSYGEKRPFFTEGLDFFNTDLDAVYTRTLRDPEWGLKVIGKEGSNTFGAYHVRDSLTNILIPGSQSSSGTSMDIGSTASIFRYNHDFGKKYTVGFLATNREADDYYNRLAGVDGNIRLSRADRFRFQILQTETQYPGYVAAEFNQPGDSFSGHACSFNYTHYTNEWDWWAQYDEISEGFRADLGFMPKVDYRYYKAGGGHTWKNEKNSWWSTFNINGTLRRYTRISDALLLNESATLNVNFNGANQSKIYPSMQTRTESYNGVEFDVTSYGCYVSSYLTGKFRAYFDYLGGETIDYSNTRPATRERLNPGFDYYVNKHMRLYLEHLYEHLDVEPGRLYTANITSATVIYQFSARSFLRAKIQYVNYDYNVENYTYEVDSEYKRLVQQLIFSYKINPRTVLYLGYTDNNYGNQDYSLRQSDRVFFMKIGYAWQI